MARIISTGNHLRYPLVDGTAPVTVMPITMACWANFNTTASMRLMTVCAATDASFYSLTQGHFSAGTIGAYIAASGSIAEAGTSTTITTGAWSHCCAVFASNVSRTAYLNGGGSGTNTTDLTPPSTMVSLTLGAMHAQVQYQDMDGEIAEAGIWNVALTTTEILALASGVSPTHVRPDALAGYWPIYGLESPEPDWKPGVQATTRYPMSLYGTPSPANFHVPIIHTVRARESIADKTDFSTERLAPDTIAASTNLTGSVTDIDEDVSSPDASWLTATSATEITDVRVTFPTPSNNPIGTQTFRAWLRKTTGDTDPTVQIELWEGGSLVAILERELAITSTTGQLVTANWHASQLSNPNGSGLEVRIVSTPASA